MQCPFCREEIIDGAKICRHCRRKQPLIGKAKKVRDQQRFWIFVGLGGFALVTLVTCGTIMGNNDRDREMAAARCAGMTYEQFDEVIRKAAKSSDLSLAQARESAIGIACPAMVKN